MAEPTFRDAGADDAATVADLVRRMVVDMATYGGHAPARDPSAWGNAAAAILAGVAAGTGRFLIAAAANGDPVGAGGADLVTLGGAFAPRTTLHVGVVYVAPDFRRRGIGGALLERLIDWGRAVGAELCDLNVLTANPARSLYERCGFQPFEVRMVRALRP